jgi:beta-phosphoglucomutase
VFPATLFDYNGVLADDELVHLEAFRDTVRPLGIEITEADYLERYLGFDDKGAFEALLVESGRPASASDVAALVEAKRPHYMNRARRGLVTFPGAAEAVRRRSAHGPVVVVSGALREEIELGLVQLGVRELIVHIVSAEDTRRSKPDPEGYLLARKYLEDRGVADAARALVIEDSLDGISAAKAAGLACVAVAQSYSRERLLGSGADLVVDAIANVDDATLDRLYASLRG